MSHSEVDLKELTAKRGIVKGKLTRFERFVNSFDSDDLTELQVRFEKCVDLVDEFDIYQNDIEMLVPVSDIHAQDKIREDFESQYFAIISKAKKMLSSNEIRDNLSGAASSQGHSSNQGEPMNHNSNKRANVKLPQIELPTFSSGYDQW